MARPGGTGALGRGWGPVQVKGWLGPGGPREEWDTEGMSLLWPPATPPAPRPLGSIQRPNSFLFRSSSQSGSGGSPLVARTNPVLTQH